MFMIRAPHLAKTN